MSTPQSISKQQAIALLWNKGSLTWKLSLVQRDLYGSYTQSTAKTIVWSCSRRLGKSYALCVIAIEKCLQKANAVVKFIAPTQKHVKMIIRPLLKEILKDCPKELKPDFMTADNIYRFKNGSEIQLAGTDAGHAENLRGGCLSEDTLIMTPQGPTPISELEVGDYVYGVNRDGSVSQTTVKNVFFTGQKEVTDIIKGNQVIASCTDDHTWLVRSRTNCFNGRKYREFEKRFGNLSNINSRIVRKFVTEDEGIIHEPHAYVLGAMIGDGACYEVGLALTIASKDSRVPDKIGKILDANVDQFNDYLFKIRTVSDKHAHSLDLHVNHYDDWLRGKTFRDKNFDWDIVNLWDRDSCLELLGGLIDTDGSVYHHKKDNNIEIQYNSSNIELLKNIQKLILKLFQVRAVIKEDNRPEKYTTPHYKLRVRSTFFVKRILKELSPHLVRDNKKWKDEYEAVPHSEHEDFVAFSRGQKRICNTYDIEVDNETHLYLTADGLVTHNSSDICIVDEAGFCDDLKYIVQSILIPTTTTTRGKIILSSTPPKSPDHEFEYYRKTAEYKGNYVCKTIYDGVGDRITTEMIDEIIQELGGADSPDFQREYLCKTIKDENFAVVPEFNDELEALIVKDHPRPPFADIYVGGDIGFKDLTVFLFGYYDFRSAKLIVEDELVMSGKRMTTEYMAQMIKQKEAQNFTNKVTGEIQEPYLRVCDNNLIVINDLYRLHNLTFQPTPKDDAAAALNNMRIMLKEGRIIINPRCKTLIYHLKNAVWNKSKKTYERSPDAGHYDAVDALKYLVRNVQYTKNPYPAGYGMGSGDSWFSYTDHKTEIKPAHKPFLDIFTVKKSLGALKRRFKSN